jgi:hypothetical protein
MFFFQAVQFSECSPSGVCQCISGYQFAGTRHCVPSIFDQSCASDSDCTNHVTNSQCLYSVGKCVCADGFNTTDGVMCTAGTHPLKHAVTFTQMLPVQKIVTSIKLSSNALVSSRAAGLLLSIKFQGQVNLSFRNLTQFDTQ